MSSFTKDDSGVSILIEYIFTTALAVVLFSMLLMNLGSIMSKSDRIVMGEELDIAASILSNQLSDYSNELQLSNYAQLFSLASTEDSARYFDLPEPYGGKQYIIEVIDDNTVYPGDPNKHRGIVKVTYAADPTVYSVATFNSPVPVQHETIYCITYNMKISLSIAGGNSIMALEEV